MTLILNWLWQGTVIAAAATALLALARPSARLRYAGWSLALCLVLALPLVIALVEASIEVPMPLPMRAPDGTPASAAGEGVVDAFWISGAVVIGIWAGWVVVQTGRLATALVALWRAKRRCRRLPPHLEARLACWTRLRQSGRPAELALSNGVQSAAVLGGLSPIVALSPALLYELTDDEIDCVVAHEWAHVQRRDDFAALGQAVVRAIAGWHPAVWWIDRQVTIEREHACDERVVELTGAAKGYATCLVKLAGLSMQPMRPLPVVAMSVSGLRPRVLRILASHGVGIPRPRRAASLAVAVVLSTLAISISGVRLIAAADPLPALAALAERIVDASPFVHATVFRTTAVESRQSTAAPSEPAGRVARLDRPAVTIDQTSAPGMPRGQSPAEPEVAPAVAAVQAESPQDVTARPVVPLDASMIGLREGLAADSLAAMPSPAAENSPTPWSAAADAGVAIGRGSQKAAVATAGLFSLFGKKLASSF